MKSRYYIFFLLFGLLIPVVLFSQSYPTVFQNGIHVIPSSQQLAPPNSIPPRNVDLLNPGVIFGRDGVDQFGGRYAGISYGGTWNSFGLNFYTRNQRKMKLSEFGVLEITSFVPQEFRSIHNIIYNSIVNTTVNVSGNYGSFIGFSHQVDYPFRDHNQGNLSDRNSISSVIGLEHVNYPYFTRSSPNPNMVIATTGLVSDIIFGSIRSTSPHSNIQHMRIKSDGKVGIGTNSPLEHLHVEGSNSKIRIHSTDASSSSFAGVDFSTNNFSHIGSIKYHNSNFTFTSSSNNTRFIFGNNLNDNNTVIIKGSGPGKVPSGSGFRFSTFQIQGINDLGDQAMLSFGIFETPWLGTSVVRRTPPQIGEEEKLRLTSHINVRPFSDYYNLFDVYNSSGTENYFHIDKERSFFTNKVGIGTTDFPINGNSNLYVNGGIETDKMSIGTDYLPLDYKLAVNGKVICDELKIQLFDNWPDYVFDQDYQLQSLEEIESFIKTNKHLPGVPKASQVEKEGVSIGEMNSLLLKKIEELSLHLIEQNKLLIYQQNEIEKLKNETSTILFILDSPQEK